MRSKMKGLLAVILCITMSLGYFPLSYVEAEAAESISRSGILSWDFEDSDTVESSFFQANASDKHMILEIADDPVDASNRVLHIGQHFNGEGVNKSSETLIPIGEIKEKSTIEYRFCVAQGQTAIFAITEGDSQTVAAGMAVRSILRPAMTLNSMNYGTEVTFGEYAANTWYTLKYVVDPTANTYTLYLDGEKVMTDARFCKNYADAGVLSALAIGPIKSVSDADIYIDDIKVYAGETEPLPEITPPDENTGSSVVSQNFDNMTIGTAPNGWEINGSATVQAAKNTSRENMLKIYDQCGDTGAYLQAFYRFPSDAGVTEISFDYMSLDAGVEARNYFRFHSSARFYVMAKNTGDTPSVYQGDTITAQKIVLGEWYRITVKKTDSGVDLYINGEFLYTFNGGELSYIEFFSRNPKTGGVGCEFFIDNLVLNKSDGTVYAEENFESMTLGSVPSGYTEESGRGWEVILNSETAGELLAATIASDTSYSPTGNSLKISDDSDSELSSASYTFEEISGAKIVFAYMTESVGEANVIEITDKSGNVKLRFSILQNTEGKVTLHYLDSISGGSVDTGYEIKTDTWYKIGLVIIALDTAELSINEQKLCDISINKTVETIGKIVFRSNSIEGRGEVFEIDELSIDISNIPTLEPTVFVDTFDTSELDAYSVNGECEVESGVLKIPAAASAERKFNPVYSGKFSVTLNGAALDGTRIALTANGEDVIVLKVGEGGGLFYKRDSKWVGAATIGVVKNGEATVIALDLPLERNANYVNFSVNGALVGTAMYDIAFDTVDGFKIYAPDASEIIIDNVSAESSSGIISMPDRTAQNVAAYLSEKITDTRVMYKLGDSSATSGAMSYADGTTAFIFDENHNSVGIDLGRKQAVNTIKLTFRGISEETINNTSGALTHFRMMGVYISDDNKTYKLINENTTGTARTTYDDGNGNAVMVFDFSGIEARYVKINYGLIDNKGLNTTRTEGGYLVMNDLENSVIATRRIARQWKLGGDVIALTEDSSPASGKLIQIYSNKQYELNTEGSIGYDFGIKSDFEAVELIGSGVAELRKENLSLYHSADGINYTEISNFVISRDKRNSEDVIRLTFDSVNSIYVKLHLKGENASVLLDDPTKDFSVYSSVEATSSFDYIRHVAARGSEGDFVALSDGSLIMSHIHYSTTTTGDNGDCALAICRSTDNGRTWSETTRIVTKADPSNLNVMHPELLELEEGKIGLFYIDRPKVGTSIMLLRTSTDNGYTWSEPIRISEYPEDGIFSFTSGRAVIRHPNGRIIVAYIYAAAQGDTSGSDRTLCYTVYSDDNGKTWIRSANGVSLPNSALEPGVAVLDNGDVLMTFRTRSENNIYHSISTDCGKTWAQPVAVEGLDTPSANQSLLSIPGTEDVVLFWSNEEYSPTSNNNGNGDRYKLSTAISSDHGLTYHNIRNVTEGLGGGGFWPVPVIYGRTVLVQFGGALQVMTFDVAQLYSALDGDVSELPKAATPTAIYNHSTGILSNVTANMLYSLDDGKTWVFAGGSTVELEKGLAKILVKDNGSITESASDIQTLTSEHTSSSEFMVEDDVHYKECTVCSARLNEEKHTYTEWSSNGDGTHTGVCICEKTSKADCSGGTATCMDKAVCTVCNESYGEKASDVHVSPEFIYVSNENGTHTKKNSCCGNVVVSDETCIGGSATCKTKAKCEICEGEYGELKAYAHNYGEHLFSKDGHLKKCKLCGVETEVEEHKYDGKICSVCGYEKKISVGAIITIAVSSTLIAMGVITFVMLKKKK